MKYIAKVPSIPITGQPFGVAEFVAYLIASDKRFNETGAGIRAGLRLEDEIKKCLGLHYVGPFQPEHYALLVEASESPSAGMPKLIATAADGTQREVLMGRQLLPILDAIKHATDSPPAEPESEIAAAAE